MIIPLDKLYSYQENRYILTKAAMQAVEKKDKIQGYPETAPNWKVVPNILKIFLEDKIKVYKRDDNEETLDTHNNR